MDVIVNEILLQVFAKEGREADDEGIGIVVSDPLLEEVSVGSVGVQVFCFDFCYSVVKPRCDGVP